MIGTWHQQQIRGKDKVNNISIKTRNINCVSDGNTGFNFTKYG